VAPGKKGIALREGQLGVLAEVAAQVSAAAAAAAAGGGALPSPAATGTKAPAAAAAATAAAPKSTGMSSEAGGPGGGAGGEEGVIDLGANRRARLNVFQGRTLVDLREFYQVGGGGGARGQPQQSDGLTLMHHWGIGWIRHSDWRLLQQRNSHHGTVRHEPPVAVLLVSRKVYGCCRPSHSPNPLCLLPTPCVEGWRPGPRRQGHCAVP
jgi:hypothetical protein